MDKLIQTLGDGLAGRSGRQQFWVRFLILNMGAAVLAFALGTLGLWPQIAGMLTLPLWLYIAARRFHDLGLTGWLGLIPLGGGLLIGIVNALIPLPIELALALMTFGPLAITLPVVLWLGCVPGQREANRFGPPPGQESPAEVF